ncbi:MAG: hypothetical protein ACMXX8_01035 [Candidatus Woesearchaeota archaeon]
MRLNQKTPGIIIVKDLRLGIIIASIIFTLIGIGFLISSISNFDLNEPTTYIGPALIIIGVGILFLWNSITTTFDKNQNILMINRRTLRNKYERKYGLNEIKEISYSEQIRRSYNSSARNRGPRTSQLNVDKTVTISLHNGESHIIYQGSSTYNPLMFNRTKNNAQKLADFLGLPLISITPGDVMRNIGSQIFGSNNQQQTMNQTPNYPQNNNQNNFNE